jgi:RimJ/RimL family protein N-acetyltransferase
MRFSSLLSLLLASVAVAQNAAQSSLSKSVQPKPFPALEQRLGGTWLAPPAQRTLANTDAKYLQLVQLFDVLGAVRVQFKTDLRNTQSQRALEKLGAIREGVLRRHMVVRDGYVRDSVYYGITDMDWPGVKRRLQERLAAGV